MTTSDTTAPTSAPAKAAKPAKPRAARVAKTEPFTLADRARAIGVNPKTARASFRRLFADKTAKDLPKLAGKGDAWIFDASARAAVDARLKSIRDAAADE